MAEHERWEPDRRAPELLSSGGDRRAGWTSWFEPRSRTGRGLVLVVGAAAVAFLVFQDVGRNTPPSPEPTAPPPPPTPATGPPAQISQGGASWAGPRWSASADAHDDFAGVPFVDRDGLYWRYMARDGEITGSSFAVQALHESVTVHGARVKGLSCEPSLAGTVFAAPRSADGPGRPAMRLGFDLDALTPHTASTDVRYAEPDGELGGPLEDTVTLPQGQVQEYRIVFHSLRRHCTFLADLLVRSGGREYHIPIPSAWTPDGRPRYGFDVTGPARRYQHAYIPVASDDGARLTYRSVVPRRLTVSDEPGETFGRLVLPKVG
ncbi:hypothetical protein LO762_09805 [Actinocorallia sp. API 0066]|uniref:hypothetical protein n=1 Tax=Actinocorallia sp. API 0066 TaxID=2896846 RepID=UPI001E3D9296|nr:hypothetical protein [Actinocorallia sp. API 0066]MCD0449483.1 hypothetical protein [Actinocorallia sp. API 0066]